MAIVHVRPSNRVAPVTLLCCILILTIPIPVECYGRLSVAVHAFVHNANAQNCDNSVYPKVRACDVKIEVIISQRSHGDLTNYKMPEYLGDMNAWMFSGKLGTHSNPFENTIVNNTGTVNLKLNIYDVDVGSEEWIFKLNLDLKTVKGAGQVGTWYKYENTKILFSWSFNCPSGDVGPLCNHFCEPKDDDRLGHYTCDRHGRKSCMAGWIGLDCTGKVPCSASLSPCKNGGTCEILDAKQVQVGFRCLCPTGYWGALCENFSQLCQKFTCHNGGTCKVYHNGKAACLCRPGYAGETCQTDSVRCLFSPCWNGAQCLDTIGSFQCACRTGFWGSRCHRDLNECQQAASNPCVNGGTCVNGLGSFWCACPDGWSGQLCQVDTDECRQLQAGQPRCKAGEQCVNTPGSFACVPADVDECAVGTAEGRPRCQNGGTCVDRELHFDCTCAPGFAGRECEQAVDKEILDQA